MRAASGVRLTREPDPLPATLANMNADATQPADISAPPHADPMLRCGSRFNHSPTCTVWRPRNRPSAAAGARPPAGVNDELRQSAGDGRANRVRKALTASIAAPPPGRCER